MPGPPRPNRPPGPAPWPCPNPPPGPIPPGRCALATAIDSYRVVVDAADGAAALAKAEDDLAKTTINAPMSGIVTKLKSQRGERVVGTAMMAGTEIMTIAQLDEMEARVEIGEIDVAIRDGKVEHQQARNG